MARLLKPKANETQREWLARQNPPLAVLTGASGKPARGRFSKEAHAALATAAEKGWTFAEATPATPTPKPKAASTKANAPAPANTGKVSEAQSIREWAQANNVPVSARGRISSDTRAAYESAQASDKEGK